MEKPKWFTGQPQPHPREDVVQEYYDQLQEAETNGYLPEHLIPETPFGSYNIIGK